MASLSDFRLPSQGGSSGGSRGYTSPFANIDIKALGRQIKYVESREPRNPSAFNDVHSLTQALHAGQINQNQWMKQFKVIQAKQPGVPKVGGYSLGDFGRNATKQTLGRAFSVAKSIPQSEKVVATGIARILPGGTADIKAQERAVKQSNISAAQIIRLQRAGKISKSAANRLLQAQLQNTDETSRGLAQTLKGMPTRGQLAAGFAGTAADILTAGTLKAARSGMLASKTARTLGQSGALAADTGLATGAAGGTKKQIAENALIGGVIPLAGGGLSKALNKAGIAAAIGKDKAVNNLINTTRAAGAAKKTSVADRLGNTGVKEVNTTRIPVREPTTTKIPVTGKSTQTMGKVTASGDTAYIKASNKLSSQYEKDLAQIQKVPHPVTQQVLQRQLDTKYASLQEKLDSNYGKSSIDFKGKSTTVKTPDNLPKSALNREPPTPFNSTRIPVTTPKTTLPTRSKVPVGTPQVSGSAIRTEQKAIEAGMKSENETIGATYNTVSHKEEAAKATQLLQKDPEKARAIAMGARGDNVSHEAAVYHAVANDALAQARKTGDYSEVVALANSPRHTTVSEAAQKLGAEGYNVNPHDPVNIMNEITKTREAQIAKRGAKTTVAKETVSVAKEVKAAAPQITRQDWHSFIRELQCK